MPSHENTFVIFKTDEGCYLAVTPEGQALLTKNSSPAAIFEISRKGDTTSRVISLLTGNPLHLTQDGEVASTQAEEVRREDTFEVRQTNSERVSIQTASGVYLKPEGENLLTSKTADETSHTAFHIKAVTERINLNGPTATDDFGVLWESGLHKALVDSAVKIICEYNDTLPLAKIFCDSYGSSRDFLDKVAKGAVEADDIDPYRDKPDSSPIPLWRNHFYDPETERNYAGATDFTAKTECMKYFQEACRDNDPYKLGLSFHFFADLHMPMHTANYTNAHDPWFCHGEYEKYADSNLASFLLDPKVFHETYPAKSLVIDMHLEKLCWGEAVLSKSIFGPIGKYLIPEKIRSGTNKWGKEADSSLKQIIPLAQKGAVMLFLRWADVMRHSKSTIYGGNGGNSFTDDLTTEKIITRVIVRHGELVDSIQLRWKTSSGDRSGERHGGGGGAESYFDLNEGECIESISGEAGDFVRKLAFKTNAGKEYTFGKGGCGSKPFTIDVKGKKILGFWGRSGAYLDAIGVCSI
jgi:hypothetical protein